MSNTAPQSSNSDSTLSQLPARVLTFLTAIGTRAPIRAALYQAGYRPEDHDEGWRLLMATGNIRTRSPNIAAQNRANAALTEIHTWVSTHFRRYRVALQRLHPEQASLFPEVDPRYPAASLLALATLVEALQRGNPSHDFALMNTLTQRLGVPQVAEPDPIQPLSDSGPGFLVLEAFEPTSEWALAARGQVLLYPSRADHHSGSVSY